MRDSGNSFNMIYQGMVNAGIDIATVLQRLAKAGFTPLGADRLPHEIHAHFWRILEDITQDPEIGLHLCPHLPIYRGRVFEYIFLSSANYEQGFRSAFQYQRLVSDAFTAHLDTGNGQARILMRGSEGDAPELRHTEICTIYSFMRAMATVTDNGFNPRLIRLVVTPIAAAEEYSAVFGCPVAFGGGTVNELQLDPAILARRTPQSDPELLQLHKKYSDNQLARQARRDMYDDVCQYLGQLIERGGLDLEQAPLTLPEVARRFGVSARHLRFILSEADTNFSRVVRNARLQQACRRLRETDDAVSQIAMDIGYSEPSAFHRSFKKWCHKSPRQYRQESSP